MNYQERPQAAGLLGKVGQAKWEVFMAINKDFSIPIFHNFQAIILAEMVQSEMKTIFYG